MSYQPEFDRAAYQDRVEVLETRTPLTEREAQVQALTEQGLSRNEIADEIGRAIHTVDGAKQRVRRKIRQSKALLELVEMSG